MLVYFSKNKLLWSVWWLTGGFVRVLLCFGIFCLSERLTNILSAASDSCSLGPESLSPNSLSPETPTVTGFSTRWFLSLWFATCRLVCFVCELQTAAMAWTWKVCLQTVSSSSSTCKSVRFKWHHLWNMHLGSIPAVSRLFYTVVTTWQISRQKDGLTNVDYKWISLISFL